MQLILLALTSDLRYAGRRGGGIGNTKRARLPYRNGPRRLTWPIVIDAPWGICHGNRRESSQVLPSRGRVAEVGVPDHEFF